jgi:hypothetical protein
LGTSLLYQKQIFTRGFFIQKVLDGFDKELVETRPKKCACGTFLSPANVPTDRAYDNFDRLGITRLSYRPGRPGIAPCDFSLFADLQTKLERNTVTSAMELMEKVNEILMDIPLHEFISVFKE